MALARLSYRDIASVWRILVAMVVIQHAGGFIGLAYGYHHYGFTNFWVGGALATAPGFIIGAIWHFSGPVDRRHTIATACLLGFMAALIFFPTIFSEIPRMKADMRLLAAVSQMHREAFDRVELFELFSYVKVLTVTEPETIAAFAAALSDAEGHSPSHPKYSRSWYAAVSGPVDHTFTLHLDPKFPDSVIGEALEKTGDNVTLRASFRSRALRPWVDEHLVPLGPFKLQIPPGSGQSLFSGPPPS